MTLLEKAKRKAKESGKKLGVEVTKGLNAVQAMHDLCKKSTSSPYKIYLSQRCKK